MTLIAAAGIAVGAAAVIPLSLAAADEPAVTRFDEISVRRLSIVEPNGRYRLVLAGGDRLPGLFLDGREYRHTNRRGGGMRFYNDDGNEVGGLTYRSNAANGTASAGLTFNQYKQDQTISLLYGEENRSRTAGLRVWDWPDVSVQTAMEMSDRSMRAPTEAERQRLRAELDAYARANKGTERMFAGKVRQDAIVRFAYP